MGIDNLLSVQALKYLEPQIRLAAKAGKRKREYTLSMVSDKTLEKVSKLAVEPIESVFTDPSYGKVARVHLQIQTQLPQNGFLFCLVILHTCIFILFYYRFAV